MSSSVLTSVHSLPRSEASVSTALSEVAVAFKHLAHALVQTAFAPMPVASQPLTAYEEAEQLRSFAADIQAKDPDFALDLFAAADRHEIEAAAKAAAFDAQAADDYSLPELRKIIANPVTPASATA